LVSLSTNETVAIDTPARCATSRMVAIGLLLGCAAQRVRASLWHGCAAGSIRCGAEVLTLL
jgi:hypothetical protein